MTTGTPLSASSTACARRPADDPAALMRQLQHPTAEDDGQLTGRHMYDRAHTATTPQLGSQDPHSATLGPQLVASWLPASLWATQLVKEQDTHRSCSAMNQDCRSCGTSAAGSFLGGRRLGPLPGICISPAGRHAMVWTWSSPATGAGTRNTKCALLDGFSAPSLLLRHGRACGLLNFGSERQLIGCHSTC